MKVTRELYNEIKARLLEAPGYTQKEVAKMVKVSQPTVSYVANSKNYKWYHQTLKENRMVQIKKKELESYNSSVAKFVENNLKKGFSPDKPEKTIVQERLEIGRVKTVIKGHLRDIYSLLKQL